MKVVVLLRRSQLDIDRLAARHPGHEFVFVEDGVALGREVADAEVLITANSNIDSAAAAAAVKASGVKWIQFSTTGIDLALRFGGFAPGTIVSNGPGLSAPVIAEHAFGLMLMIGHRLRLIEAAAARREWRRELKDEMIALYGKTLCIIGLGAVGQQAAKRARAFGMTVVGVSRTETSTEDVSVVYPRDRLLQALARTDVVLLSTVADAETANMIGDAAFAAMKPNAILINIARGELVDEAALVTACRSGRLAGAGLDVTKTEPLPKDSPLWSLPNVVITPHLAGGGSDKSSLLIELLDENIRRYLAGQPLRHTVDWQNITLA